MSAFLEMESVRCWRVEPRKKWLNLFGEPFALVPETETERIYLRTLYDSEFTAPPEKQKIPSDLIDKIRFTYSEVRGSEIACERLVGMIVTGAL